MSVRVSAPGVIELSAHCGVEDAEVLQRYLLGAPGSTVEWTGCELLHSAVIQVLLVGGPRVRGEPKAAFLKDHVAPIIGRSTKTPTSRSGNAASDTH
jgi:hypothetical protein